MKRDLKTAYKTSWYLAHRIHKAMGLIELADEEPLTGIVEADETYMGSKNVTGQFGMYCFMALLNLSDSLRTMVSVAESLKVPRDQFEAVIKALEHEADA